LKCPVTLRWREEILKADGCISMWNWQTGKVLTAKNANIKCEWENKPEVEEKARMRLVVRLKGNKQHG
jgi:hypothetical protein